MCCRVLQCDAVYHGVLQCVLQCVAMCKSEELQIVAVCCIVLQFVALLCVGQRSCTVLQRVAGWCSVV